MRATLVVTRLARGSVSPWVSVPAMRLRGSTLLPDLMTPVCSAASFPPGPSWGLLTAQISTYAFTQSALVMPGGPLGPTPPRSKSVCLVPQDMQTLHDADPACRCVTLCVLLVTVTQLTVVRGDIR